MEIRDNLSDGILFVMFLKRNSLTVKKIIYHTFVYKKNNMFYITGRVDLFIFVRYMSVQTSRPRNL